MRDKRAGIHLFLFFFSFLVLFFSPPPVSAFYTNESASVVVGQPDFVSGSANQRGSVTGSGFDLPQGAATDGTRLVINDYNNSRVLIFNHIPTINNPSADVVIGQTNFTNNSINQGGSAGANTLSNPFQGSIDRGRLIIGDQGNNRVLIYNSIPTSNNASADIVVGQPDMTTTSTGITASKFNAPEKPIVDPGTGKLFIVDRKNNRVLIYNQVPTTNGAAANVVVGQTSFTTKTTGTTASTFNLPVAVSVADGKLLVADFTNNRVLVWNSIPTTNGKAADVVIGQANFTSGSANQGGNIAANTLNQPNAILPFNNQLYVSDMSNSRLLLFSNQLPDTTFTNTMVSGIGNGLQRLKGRASTNVVNGRIVGVEWSINGSDSWTGAFPMDDSFNEATEDYFFDFDPKSNNPDTGKNEGFTIRVRNTHGNTVDVSPPRFCLLGWCF